MIGRSKGTRRPADAGPDAFALQNRANSAEVFTWAAAYVKDGARCDAAVGDGHGQGVGDRAGVHVVRELLVGHGHGRQVDHRGPGAAALRRSRGR